MLNRLRQTGDALLYIAVIAFVGAAIGGAAYHLITVSAYKSKISTLETQAKADKEIIGKQAKDNAEKIAENAALKVANAAFDGQVKKQNEALVEVQRQRDEADAKAKAAARQATIAAAKYETRIQGILATKAAPGEQWYDTWRRILRNYYQERKSP